MNLLSQSQSELVGSIERGNGVSMTRLGVDDTRDTVGHMSGGMPAPPREFPRCVPSGAG